MFLLTCTLPLPPLSYHSVYTIMEFIYFTLSLDVIAFEGGWLDELALLNNVEEEKQMLSMWTLEMHSRTYLLTKIHNNNKKNDPLFTLSRMSLYHPLFGAH